MLKGTENEILKLISPFCTITKIIKKCRFMILKKFSWLLLSFPLFLRLAHANNSFILILPCFPYDVYWLNNEALSFQILCKSILCPLWKTLLCSPVVIVLACSPAFNYLLHNSLWKWQAFIAALTLDIIRRKCGVSAGVSLEQSFLFYVIYFFRQFYGSDDPPLPVPPKCLPLFICYLTFRKLALSTIYFISFSHLLRTQVERAPRPHKIVFNSQAINGSQPSTASWHTFSGDKTCFTWAGSCT